MSWGSELLLLPLLLRSCRSGPVAPHHRSQLGALVAFLIFRGEMRIRCLLDRALGRCRGRFFSLECSSLLLYKTHSTPQLVQECRGLLLPTGWWCRMLAWLPSGLALRFKQ